MPFFGQTLRNSNDGSDLSERLSTGPSWTTFTIVTPHTIPLTGDPFQEYRAHLEKDAPPQASQLRLKPLKADGTIHTISYIAWRLGPMLWGFSHDTAATAGNDAVV